MVETLKPERNSDMISNDDDTDGKSIPHDTGNKGYVRTVRVGSRSLPLYPLVIVCLGLLNTILMLPAVVIGVYCGKVSEISAPDQTAQILILEFKAQNELYAEIIKSQEEAKQELNKELRRQEKMKLQMDQNQTLCDRFQSQIEGLHVEKATLQSEIADIQGNCGRCLQGWKFINSTCYFFSKSKTTTLKNWQDSRADCINRGGNLTVIDNLEEQLNLNEFQQKDQSSNQRDPNGAWVGLTFVPAKHSWVWLNGETLHDER
ncbi:oxidized low-density lipoprotein receptor 1-like [Notolabrus celidotus]|uniref:oxidized low-density lipoprotein receptor 1-like n=1 Tax=Notolabrus celidotus TaxID=1203425 RepID=UPI00148FFBD7|nr:oxidized low-density lipoprotein receptor 1-like [Notolabrus celidotus]